MSDLNPQPLPPRVVSVQLPSSVFNDLDSFQKVHASLLDLAGHSGCTSGIQFKWQQYENYVVGLDGSVSPVPGLGNVSFGGR